jgi:hypothetical protein
MVNANRDICHKVMMAFLRASGRWQMLTGVSAMAGTREEEMKETHTHTGTRVHIHTGGSVEDMLPFLPYTHANTHTPLLSHVMK